MTKPGSGLRTKQARPPAKMDDLDISTQSNYKNLSQYKKETITDKENVFSFEGLLSAIIEDIATIKEEHRSTQKSLVSLIPIVRQIVQDEITKLRGFQ